HPTAAATQDTAAAMQIDSSSSAALPVAPSSSSAFSSSAASSSSASASSPPASVVAIRIHYKGFSAKYDEWLRVETDFTSDYQNRIAALHAHTKALHPILHPTPDFVQLLH